MDKIILYGLFGRTIVAVVRNPSTFDELKAVLPEIQCALQMNLSEALGYLASGKKVDAILYEVDSPISSGLDFLSRVLAIDGSSAPVFFVSDKLDQQYYEAFFQGVEAIFFKPLEVEKVLKSIAFSLSMLTDQSMRQHPRRRLKRARIQYSPSEGLPANGYVADISAGGMFISSMSELPKEGDIIKYKLMYRADESIEINGSAIVKWIRPGLELGRPPGFGVQFDNPSERAKELILRLVAEGNI